MKYNPTIVLAYWRSCGVPTPFTELKFHPERRWRFDFAWDLERVALEVQGGLFTGGRHTQGAALVKEYEKLTAAACLGWRVLFCQPRDLCMESTVVQIREALRWAGKVSA